MVEGIFSEESGGWAHLSIGSVDVVEVFVETTVSCYHVQDRSVALPLLDIVVVELANDRGFIRSDD